MMKNKLKIFFAVGLLLALGINGCRNKPADNGADYTISPEAGKTYKAGDVVKIKVGLPAEAKPDSIVYMMEATRLGSAKDTSGISIKTDTIPLGIKIITAKVYSAGKSQDVNTNILLLAAKAPENYTFKVEKTFPHDTSSFTEGLEYLDGFMYESSGGTIKEGIGQSSLRKVDLETGKILQKVMVDSNVFAEGISIVGNKIIQLTWKEKIGYEYDKSSFKLLKTFQNNVGLEGWGLCFDGKKLYMDDSTNRIWFLDKDNYRQTGFIDVCDDKGPINEINELEYIDGKIYANIWKTDIIIVIDPKTGAVLEKVDLTDLYPQAKRIPPADVLNGIAWDNAGKRLFVTGKKWQKIYQVKFSPLVPKG